MRIRVRGLAGTWLGSSDIQSTLAELSRPWGDWQRSPIREISLWNETAGSERVVLVRGVAANQRIVQLSDDRRGGISHVVGDASATGRVDFDDGGNLLRYSSRYLLTCEEVEAIATVFVQTGDLPASVALDDSFDVTSDAWEL